MNQKDRARRKGHLRLGEVKLLVQCHRDKEWVGTDLSDADVAYLSFAPACVSPDSGPWSQEKMLRWEARLV